MILLLNEFKKLYIFLFILLVYNCFYNYPLYSSDDTIFFNRSENFFINGNLEESQSELSKIDGENLKLSKEKLNEKIDNVNYFSNYIISNINSKVKLITYRISDFDGDGEDDLFLIHGVKESRVNPKISNIIFSFVKSNSKSSDLIVREIDSNKIYRENIAVFVGNLNRVIGNEIVVKLFDKDNDDNCTIAIFGNDFLSKKIALFSIFNSQNGMNKRDDILDINGDKLFEIIKYKKLNFGGDTIYFPIIYTWFDGKIIPYPQGFSNFYNKISKKIRKTIYTYTRDSKNKIECYYYLALSLRYEKKYNKALKIMNMILTFLEGKHRKNFDLINRINKEMREIRKEMRKDNRYPVIFKKI